MAKARAKRPTKKAERTKEEPQAGTKKVEPLDPKTVHELFGLQGPYEPPPPPIPTKGYETWWDPDISIRDLARKQPKLFYLPGALDEPLAKDTDSWNRRQIRLQPIEPN